MEKMNKYTFIALVLCLVNAVGMCLPVQAIEHQGYVIQEEVKGSTLHGDEIIDFQASRAVVDSSSGALELQENVEFKTSEGRSLSTDKLRWEKQRDLVYTDERVVLKNAKPPIAVTGTGMQAKPQLKEIVIEQDVEIIIDQEDSKYIMITCEGQLDIRYEEGLAILTDAVHVSQTDTELFADKATVYFDAEKRVLDKIVAENNVMIVRGQDKTYAQTATYYATEKRIVLTGRPRLVIFPDKENDELFSDWSTRK